MNPRFYSARLKVCRAKEHVNELYRRAQIFAETHPHTVTVENDPDTGNDVLRIAPADPLPDELLLILGDALHNLRAALDHAWGDMQMVRTKWNKFPFKGNGQELESAIDGLKEKGPPENIKRFLIDVVQPYPAGRGQPLVDLHNIDIEDKHILLIAHLQFTFVSGLKAIDERGEEFPINDWLILPHRTTSRPFEGHSKFHITDYGSARTEVVFGDGMPFEHRNVMPTLKMLTELISRFLDCCDSILNA